MRRGLALVVSYWWVTGLAAAHPGIGTRFDAPVPLSLLFAGAGLTVAATAGYLAASGRAVGTGDRRLARIDAAHVRTLRTVARGGFFLLFVVALADGLLGRQVQLENLATVFVWPLWLKGVALIAVVAGSPWRVLSPWRTLYLGLCHLEGGELSRRPYPAWLGAWPALLGVLALGFVENLTVIPRDPLLTAALLAGYALVMLLGGVLFGPTWFERADALEVLYGLFGRVRTIDLRRVEAGRDGIIGYDLRVRPPWRGVLDPVSLAAVGVVVASVFTVSFDGFRETPEFQAVAAGFRDAFGPGLGAALPVYLLGFALFAGVFWVAAWLTTRTLGRAPRSVAGRLAPTVLPIAAAYELAHNVDYLLVNLGAALSIIGTNVDPTAWLSVPVYWGGQVLLIVLGHVVAVVAAHAVLTRLGEPGRAHLPLTGVMVAYTLVSLWILSRPVAA